VGRRTTLGRSQKEAAWEIGVDPGTLARWERGKREPIGGFLARVKAFLTARRIQDVGLREPLGSPSDSTVMLFGHVNTREEHSG
jgi:transcriptional regulator with XRE-family HTH domain